MEQIDEERVKKIRDEKSFIVPIMRMLQENGGELANATQIDKLIPEYTDFTENDINFQRISRKGNKYAPYAFSRNFALKNLSLAGLITYGRNLPIKLTTEGFKVNTYNMDPLKDVYEKTAPYWEKKNEERKMRSKSKEGAQDDEDSDEAKVIASEMGQDWRNEILEKVKLLDPYKFEQFSRGLLRKMGFDIDPVKGIKRSNDGGIDGFAYCLDDQSLKTTRVVIQCKRFANGAVGGPDINNLRGAVDTHRADYGIFITTSYFSKDAIESSRVGGTPITLIDGEHLVDLMIRYKYKVREVSTYIPDPEYFV